MTVDSLRLIMKEYLINTTMYLLKAYKIDSKIEALNMVIAINFELLIQTTTTIRQVLNCKSQTYTLE